MILSGFFFIKKEGAHPASRRVGGRHAEVEPHQPHEPRRTDWPCRLHWLLLDRTVFFSFGFTGFYRVFLWLLRATPPLERHLF